MLLQIHSLHSSTPLRPQICLHGLIFCDSLKRPCSLFHIYKSCKQTKFFWSPYCVLHPICCGQCLTCNQNNPTFEIWRNSCLCDGIWCESWYCFHNKTCSHKNYKQSVLDWGELHQHVFLGGDNPYLCSHSVCKLPNWKFVFSF